MGAVEPGGPVVLGIDGRGRLQLIRQPVVAALGADADLALAARFVGEAANQLRVAVAADLDARPQAAIGGLAHAGLSPLQGIADMRGEAVFLARRLEVCRDVGPGQRPGGQRRVEQAVVAEQLEVVPQRGVSGRGPGAGNDKRRVAA